MKKKHLLTLLALPFIQSSALAKYEIKALIHKQKIAPVYVDHKEENEVDEVDAETLELNNNSSVDDVLTLSPAATTARGPRSSGESPQVRGLDTGKIFVMVDGVRQNFRSGHNSMIPVDLENLKKVEIFKNASDLSKGGSLGGGVQFITKDPEDYLSPRKNIGSSFKVQHNGANEETSINAKAAHRANGLSKLISITSSNAGKLELNDGKELENSSYEDLNVLTKLKYKDVKFTYEFFQREDDSPLDPTLNPPERIKSLQADSRLTKNSFILDYTNPKYVNASLYQNQFLVKKERRSDERLEERKIITNGLRVNKRFEILEVGGEHYTDKLTSNTNGTTINSFPEAEGSVTEGYIQAHLNKGNFYFSPGVKFSGYQMKVQNADLKNKSATHLSKKLYASYKPDKAITFFSSYSEGFNAPRVNQVYPSGLHSKGDDFIIRDNYFIPNLDLKHETSQITEFGVSFKRHAFTSDDRLELNLSTYENRIENYIYLERIDRSIIDEEDGTTQFVNIPKASLYGSEIELRYLYDIFDAKIAYSKVRGKNETKGLYLEDLPADAYTFDFKVFIDKYRLNLGYLGVQTFDQHRINEDTIQRTDKTNGYYFHNIYASKKLGRHFEVNVKVNNLGNRKYRKHASHLYESREDVKIAFKYKINMI